MPVKRRNKVSAEFSMSSLTDIIFLLLIFFMLTSTLVAPNALNLKLPGNKSSKRTVVDPMNVSIKSNGDFQLNGRSASANSIETALSKEIRSKGNPKNVSVTISPEQKAPVEAVVVILDMARKLQIEPVLATTKY